MTALAGFWNDAGGSSRDRVGDDPLATCAAMLKAQQVYAPDARARIEMEGSVALGRCLHLLLPEDRFDAGPYVDASGRILVADVRIDNRAELRRSLDLGADASRIADATLFGLALERWDAVATAARLVGDWAFAQWDPRTRSLLLGRDFLGMRPLHYAEGPGFVAVASMPKGLHALPDIPRAPDPAAAIDFLSHLPLATGTSFFAGIASVPAGCVVRIDRNGRTITRHWSPDLSPLTLRDPRDYADALREQLDVAVAGRLRGTDGRVAAHLSGGLDSASVAATAARQLAGSGAEAAVVAYTSVPRDGFVAHGPWIADEGPAAAAVAAMYPNMEHVRIRSGRISPLDSLARDAFLYECPTLNLCNGVWIDAINDDARARRLTVMLTGTMGNAGFSYDGMPWLAELAARGRWFALTRDAARLRQRGVRVGTVAAAALGPFTPPPLWRLIRRARGRSGTLRDYSAIHPGAMRDRAAEARAASVDFANRPRRDATAARLGMLGRVDLGTYHKGTLGGWGIDKRDPTADRRLIELCLRIPVDQFLHGGIPRSLARRAMADRLPTVVTDELRKGYQGADWYEGMAGAQDQMRHEVASIARDPAAAAIVDTARLAALAESWPTQGWERSEVDDAYRLAALRGVSIGHFMRDAAGTN